MSGRRREKLVRLLPLACVLFAGVGLQAVPVEGRLFARGGAAFSPKGLGESLAFVERSAALAVPGLDGLAGGPRRAAAWAAVMAFAGYVLVRRCPLALFGLAWVVLAHLPFYLFVPRMGDLYLYLPLAGVALVVSDAATLVDSAASRPLLRAAAALGGAGFVVWSAARIGDAALRWRAAGEVVEGVVAEVKAAQPSLAHGATLVLEGLPDYVGGVYAFQNAVPAAFWLAFDDRTVTVIRPRPGDTLEDLAGPRFLYEEGLFYEVDGQGRRRLLRTFSGAD